jgi:IS30 family transposase
MGRPAGWMEALTGRSPMKSPGRPSLRREVQREFWREIAKGLRSEEAGVVVGASGAAGSRWFREGGGMPSVDPSPLSGRYLSFSEREEIAILKAQGVGVRETARRLGRSPSTISRELRRNAATRSGRIEYRASVAQWKAELVARRPKTAKLVADERLREYVQQRLAGQLHRADVTPVAGPATGPWKGRNKPRRQDRRWVSSWSPQQISERLKIDFPDDPSMRISHEAIYQALYVQSRGALKRELVACLRTGRALRVPRARTRNRPGGHVTAEVMISERPAEAADRAVPGHWEGDLIIGADGASAVATLVERTTRFGMLVQIDTKQAEHVAERLATAVGRMPAHLTRSLTWDQGTELAAHASFSVATTMPVFFCDPHSPWQRGTNENWNGLVRQFLPKSTDLSVYSQDELDHIAALLNGRPRKTLTWDTPAERFNELVATTT